MALRDKLRLILSIKDTPHRISMAFATGVFIGMSPLFGIHTLLGILVAWVFRLNKLATIVGVYITNPWTIIPIYTFSTWVGAKCLGINSILPDVDWRHITFTRLLNEFSPLLMPFVVGTMLIGTITSVLSYIIIYKVVNRRSAEAEKMHE
ncbi:MAG: DUF2062 domain-containing protein [Thermodesulfovibrionales bacterium]